MTPEAAKIEETKYKEEVTKLQAKMRDGSYSGKPLSFAQLRDTLGVVVGDKIPENAVEIKGLPDAKCRECFGKGYIRRIIQNVREIEPCTCLGR